MKALFAILMLVGLGFATQVVAKEVSCTMEGTSNPFYVSPEIRLTIGDFYEVSVRDSIIASTGRSQVIGAIARDDAARLAVLWEVRNVKPDPKETRAYPAHLLVRLSVEKASGAARMTIRDGQGRRYEYRATGTCRVEN